MRITFIEVAIPPAAIFISVRTGVPRRTPTIKKQTKPASRAQAKEIPLTIHPATQAKNTPNAASRSMSLSPNFSLGRIVSLHVRFVTSFSRSLFSFLFDCDIL